MAKKILVTNLGATEAWNKVKKLVNSHDKLYSLRDKIKWNDSEREATLTHKGVNAKIRVKEGSKCTIEVEVDAAFPASLFVDEGEIVSSVVSELKKYV